MPGNDATFDHAAAIAMYQGGATMQEVAERYGITKARVQQVMARAGVSRGRAVKHRIPHGSRPPVPRADLIRRYRAGASQDALKVRYGVGRERIKKELIAAGMELRKPGQWNTHRTLPDAKIVARYQAGESSTAIARRYRCSRKTILDHLRRCGVAIRPPGHQTSRTP